MKTVLIDASSAILLFKTGGLDLLIQHYHTVVAPEVCREITVPGYPGADYFKRLFEKQRIEVPISEPYAKGLPGGDGLGRGEHNTLIFHILYPDAFIIMDDKKGSAYCRKNNIPYINALLVPKILYFSGIIPEVLYLQLSGRISTTGRYSQTVLVTARALTKKDLTFFLCDKHHDNTNHQHAEQHLEA